MRSIKAWADQIGHKTEGGKPRRFVLFVELVIVSPAMAVGAKCRPAAADRQRIENRGVEEN